MADPLRIAMWSGPRNLSTALMRSFSSRSDCAVVDEPFYAAYLKLTGLKHPMWKDVIEAGETDPDHVADDLLRPMPPGKIVFYQKHMLQHMVDGIPVDWMGRVRHVFLIRDPARVVASYQAKRETVSLKDLGVEQQKQFFEQDASPIVVDAADILAAPEAMLRRLCAALDLSFDPAMLHWPAGAHPDDGVWGKHWYGRIWASTGFDEADPGPRPAVDRADIMEPAMALYEAMHAVRLKAED